MLTRKGYYVPDIPKHVCTHGKPKTKKDYELELRIIKIEANAGYLSTYPGSTMAVKKANFRDHIFKLEEECRNAGYEDIATIMKQIRTGHPYVMA
jgi:hypothetical protein